MPRGPLPDPRPVIENLARAAIEVLADAGDLDQLSRWLDIDVYGSLSERLSLRARAHDSARPRPRRALPHLSIGSVRIFSPADDVIEAAAVVYDQHRARAVTMRLVGRTGRWVATHLRVL